MKKKFLDKLDGVNLSAEFKDKFCDFLDALDCLLVQDDFRCMVLHADVLKDNFTEGVTPLELLIIPSEADINTLEKIHTPIQNAMQAFNLLPVVVSYEELLLSADAFPVKYLEIKNNYIILTGEDLIKELYIPPANIILHCEQELRKFSLKLRNDFISMYPDEFNLYNALIKYMPELISTIRLFVEFKSGRKFSKISEVLAYLKEQFGIPYDSINDMISLHKKNSVLNREEIKEIYSKLNTLMNELTRKADAE